MRDLNRHFAGRILSTYPNLSLFFVPGSLTRPLMTIQGRCILRWTPTHLLPDKKSAAVVCQYSLLGVRNLGRASVRCFVFLENGWLVPFIVAFVCPLPRAFDRQRPGGSQRWSAITRWPGKFAGKIGKEKAILFSFSLSLIVYLSPIATLTFQCDFCTSWPEAHRGAVMILNCILESIRSTPINFNQRFDPLKFSIHICCKVKWQMRLINSKGSNRGLKLIGVNWMKWFLCPFLPIWFNFNLGSTNFSPFSKN